MGDEGKGGNLFNHFFISEEPDVKKPKKKKEPKGNNDGNQQAKNGETSNDRPNQSELSRDPNDDGLLSAEEKAKAEQDYLANHRKWLVSGRDTEEESFLQWVMNGKSDDMAKVNKLVPPRHWTSEDSQFNVDDEGYPGSKANFSNWVRNGRNDDRQPTTILAKVIPPSGKEALLMRLNNSSDRHFADSDREYVNWVTNGTREDERRCRKKLFKNQLDYDSDPEDNPYQAAGRQARH